MKRKIKISILCFLILLSYDYAQNYSKQLQQAILLYQEGKNTDAMDRFMDVLVSGTPEEKTVASEYISKITQGIGPQQKTSNTSDTKIVTSKNQSAQTNSYSTENKQANDNSQPDRELTEQDIIAKKVNDKLKQFKNDILVSIYRSNFIKLYMNETNDKPLFIVLKEDKIFNDDMTFKTAVIGELKQLAGLIDALGKVTITMIPNGAISGNMKIANVRKATTIHSYFLSHGISPTKIKIDIVGNYSTTQITKKIDDFDGIIMIFDYSKEPELVIDSEFPAAYIALYPDKINTDMDEVCIVDFAVLMGKNPLATWKLLLNKKTNTYSQSVQKIENTVPIHSQIVFNGKEKFIGNNYEPGEYEFLLEVTDTKGNTSRASKNLVIISGSQTINSKTIAKKNEEKKTEPKKPAQNEKKSPSSLKDIFYKIYFKPQSLEITDISMQALGDFLNDIKGFKNSKIIITGYAYSKESKPKTMAYRRALTVKNALVKKYHVKSSRIILNTKVVNFKKTICELKVK